MTIRIACYSTQPGQTGRVAAYIYEQPDGTFACAAPGGTPLGEWPGIMDRMSCGFALSDLAGNWPDEELDAKVLETVHAYATRYVSGPNMGDLTYRYKVWEPLV